MSDNTSTSNSDIPLPATSPSVPLPVKKDKNPLVVALIIGAMMALSYVLILLTVVILGSMHSGYPSDPNYHVPSGLNYVPPDSLEYDKVSFISSTLIPDRRKKLTSYTPSTAKQLGIITVQETQKRTTSTYVETIPTTVKIVNSKGNPYKLGEKDFCVQEFNGKTGKPILYQNNTMPEPAGGVCPNLKQ